MPASVDRTARAAKTAHVVIVGGGVMGAAAACFLARDHALGVTVLERDPSYAQASSALSASSIRQQFSQPVNIALSQASFGFLRGIASEIAVAGEALPDVGLVERGYLMLAGLPGADVLRTNHAVQRAHGADVALLDAAALRERMPWIAVDGIALAALGLSGEGWFDGYGVLHAFRRKAIACGARFVKADAARLLGAADRIDGVLAADGTRFDADAVLVAAGAWSAPLLARVGVAIPVRARKRDVFVVDAPVALPGCPLVVDTSGVWFRPEGDAGRFIVGAPPRGEDRDDVPLDAIDHGLFDDVIWPALAARVPAFEALRVRSAWAGYYEMNTFDHNGLVGPLPGWRNLHVACGFSGHGLQQAPAVGRAIAAWIADGAWPPGLDLTPLAPGRVDAGRPLVERNVI